MPSPPTPFLAVFKSVVSVHVLPFQLSTTDWKLLGCASPPTKKLAVDVPKAAAFILAVLTSLTSV